MTPAQARAQQQARYRAAGLWLGGSIVFGLILCAIFAPWIAPYPIDHVNGENCLAPPSMTHWLGTDEHGADLLGLVIFGTRIAVVVGFGTVAISMLIGTFFGCISGYYGGWVDELIMRLVEVLLSFPGILLAILIIFLTQEPSEWTVILALSVTGWATYARLVRGQVLSVKEWEFVRAARCLGASNLRIMTIHIVPNTLGPVIVQATFGIAGAILAEASLSFLGLGPQGSPSWGALLDQGALLFIKTPHVAVSAGMAIAMTVLEATVAWPWLWPWHP